MRIEVLDHGYVEFVEAWGHGKAGEFEVEEGVDEVFSDYEVGIIEAARQSTQGSFRSWEKDAKLLERLYSHNHSTPFEFAGMVIEVQAPIFVFREWHRHRTQSYNEMSARYAPLPDLYYFCSYQEVIQRAHAAQEEKNKQAGAVGEIDTGKIVRWVKRDLELATILEAHYQEGLACGVPKELARKKMPVDHYSRMRATTSLRNWLAFLTLRQAPDAQKEIRLYANAVAEIISVKFPQTYKLFTGI